MIYNNEEPIELINEINKTFIGKYRDWDKFLDILIAVLEEKEEEYLSLIKEMPKEELMDYNKCFGLLLKFFYLEQKYWDVLGYCYMRIFQKRMKGSDEAYTPFHICRAMVAMSDPKPKDNICDPCVGSGAFLIATKEYLWLKYKNNYGMNMYGMDISSRAVKMAKIQDYLTNYNYMGLLLLKQVEKLKNNN